jgi:hypothetical protein
LSSLINAPKEKKKERIKNAWYISFARLFIAHSSSPRLITSTPVIESVLAEKKKPTIEPSRRSARIQRKPADKTVELLKTNVPSIRNEMKEPQSPSVLSDDAEGGVNLEMNQDGRIAGEYNDAFDFTFRGVTGLIDSSRTLSTLDADCRLLRAEEASLENKDELDATFWIPARPSNRPNKLCLLERLAEQIFDHYCAGIPMDMDHSGAEWWVQVRQLDEGYDDDSGSRKRRKLEDERDETKGETIQFHFDKDEVLTAVSGLYVPPAVSTVTYINAIGAPTCIVPQRYDNETCSIVATEWSWPNSSALLSHPYPGNHICFDGRFLHGAPAAMKQTNAGGERISFLVNIWIDHVPLGLDILPRHIAAKLSQESDLKLSWTNAAGFIEATRIADIHEFPVHEGGQDFALRLPRHNTLQTLTSTASLVLVPGTATLELL